MDRSTLRPDPSDGAPPSPYKFLDPYDLEDADLFFGREREIRILLSDIVISRLVVLFAPTGTGKTSLINAGVRPRLHDREYVTFYIRVSQDPVESARAAFLGHDAVRRLPRNSLDALLSSLTRRRAFRKRAVVLIFDQFEEFFLYGSEQQRTRFIQDVAQWYHNRESGVYFVFSMREEFFVEMDAFRREIPTIFHNESNLRLAKFDLEHATQAIVQPAARYGIRYDSDLVERLLADLQEEGRIEPARLQIVCDTLWDKQAQGTISLQAYKELGGDQEILRRRLEKDLEENLDLPQLRLLEDLLDKLLSERGTRYIREFDELVAALGTDAATLDELLVQLDNRLHLIRQSVRYEKRYVEWASDYLAGRTVELRRYVQAASLRRLLRDAMDRAEEARQTLDAQTLPSTAPWPEAPTDELRRALYLSPGDLDALSRQAGLLENLAPEQAEFLFVAALEHGAHEELWFRQAAQHGDRCWEMLETRIAHGEVRSPQVDHAITFLARLGGPRAVALLERALRNPVSGPTALVALRELPDAEAVPLLEEALAQDALASQAIDQLRRRGTPEAIALLERTAEQGGDFSLRAGTALGTLSDGPPGEASTLATQALERHAQDLFRLALKRGAEMLSWYNRAEKAGVDAWEILSESISSPSIPVAQAENAVNLLGQLATPDAVSLLQSAFAGERLTSQAQRAMEQIEQSSTAQPTAREQIGSVLETWRKEVEGPSSEPPTPPEIRLPTPDPRVLADSDWTVLLRLIATGRCTPVLGPGLTYGVLPLDREVAERWAKEYNYPLRDSSDLARVAQYLAVQNDPIFPKEEYVQRSLARAEPPDLAAPDEPHAVLASLPLPLYVTTNYDDFLLRALQSHGKSARRELCPWNRYVSAKSGADREFEPTVSAPLVYHLFGHAEAIESLVLTEDDYLDYVIEVSRDRALLPVPVREALATMSLLLIGYDVSSLAFQALRWSFLEPARGTFQRSNVAVLLPPAYDALEFRQRQAQGWLARLMGQMETRVYWGTPREFAAELRERWQAFSRETR